MVASQPGAITESTGKKRSITSGRYGHSKMKRGIGASEDVLQPTPLGSPQPIQSEWTPGTEERLPVELVPLCSNTATKEWAEKAVEWYSYELGGDSEQVMELQKTLAQAWGTQEKMDVGRPSL